MPILSIIYYYLLWYFIGDFEQTVNSNLWIANLFLIIFLAELWATPYQTMAENYILGKNFSISGGGALLIFGFRLAFNAMIWYTIIQALIGHPPMIFLAFILLKEVLHIVLAHRKLKQAPTPTLKILADFIVFNALSISTYILSQMFIADESLKIKWGYGWEGALIAIIFFIVFYNAIQLYHINYQWRKAPDERTWQVVMLILSAVLVIVPLWW